MVTSATAAPAPSSTAVAASSDPTALGRTQLANNFDTFLSLLTTQLKNQDPLSPLDSTQFTQQLVQMSGVEQQLLTNSLLKQVASNTGTGISTAVGLIGKDVKAVSDTASLANGKAQWTFNLPSDATDLKIEVLDANGGVVHAEAGAAATLKAGDHDFTWNGKTLNGSTAPAGSYTLRVTATDASDKAITTTNYVQGRVTAVEQSNGKTLITVNGTPVSWDTVKSITEPTTASTTTAGGSGSTPTAQGGA